MTQSSTHLPTMTFEFTLILEIKKYHNIFLNFFYFLGEINVNLFLIFNRKESNSDINIQLEKLDK